MRMLRSIAASFLLFIATALLGTVAFRSMEGFSRIDAALSCALIMTGVGHMGVINTAAGNIFTPFLHRLLHKFHPGIKYGCKNHLPHRQAGFGANGQRRLRAFRKD